MAEANACVLRVELKHRVRCGMPPTDRHCEPGEHRAYVGPRGAVSVDGTNGMKLSLVPGEFEWLPIDAGQWTLYVAGPMRGHDKYNFPAFDDAASRLRERGYRVVSPAEIDRVLGTSEDMPETDITRGLAGEFIRRDVAVICSQCDGIALLSNWRRSSGAKVEVALADYLGLPAMEFEKWLELPKPVIEETEDGQN